MELRAGRVQVPCSTSNLGAGFDCIGLALDRYLKASFDPGGKGLSVERAGTLAGLPDIEGDTVAATFRTILELRGVSRVDGMLSMTSTIPVARGLGSSAAATLAGLLLASVALGEWPAPGPVLEAAAGREGHPDNAAPSLLGGLVGVTRLPGGEQRAFRLTLSEDIEFAFAAPPVEVSTALARKALPESVSHRLAVRSLSRAAALVRGLETADPDLLRAGFADELHVPWRRSLIPGADAASEAAREAGAWAVTISGSGSGMIAVCGLGRATTVAAAMAAAFEAADPSFDPGGVIAMAVSPDLEGARLQTEAG